MRDVSFVAFIKDQLHGLPGLVVRPMFGGYGLYAGPAFFGIVFRGRLYFKTDSDSRRDYAARGMRPFRPSARQTLTSYYEVPADVVEDAEALQAWADRAVHAQAGRPG